MDFIIDGRQYQQVQQQIVDTAVNVANEVTLIYAAIEHMREGWDSKSYYEFKAKMEEFQGPLNDVVIAMVSYGDLLAEFSKAVKLFQEGIQKALNMEVSTEGEDPGISDVEINSTFEAGTGNAGYSSPFPVRRGGPQFQYDIIA